MPAPLEIFATGAVDLYLAPIATAEPPVNAAPPVAWVKVGVAGSKDYGEDGVRVTKGTTNNEIFALGSYGVRKVFRERETLKVALTLMDATLEAFRDAFNQTVVTTALIGAGPAADKTIPLLEDQANPTFRAALVRMSNSPYMDGGGFQFWIPLVYQTGTIEAVFRKNEPIGLALDFTAIADSVAGFGKIKAQTA